MNLLTITKDPVRQNLRLFRTLVQVLGAIGVTGVIIGALLYWGIIRVNYPSRDRFPIQGIDVSNHQSEIDWSKIKQQGVDFAYIKATEGGDFPDPYFINNWQGAEKAGIIKGAYHFFTFCKTGLEQANNFIELVPRTKASLPPVIDLEFGGNCRNRLAKSGVITELKLISDRMEMAYSQTPIIYATKEVYNTFLVGNFPESKIWIRDIWQQPTLPDSRKR